MGVQVTFDYTSWVTGYPQFSTIPQATVTGVILELAEGFCVNNGGGPVTDLALQTNLLNLAVAHVAALFFGVNGQTPSGLVGRISDATEGSVSVRADFPSTPNSAWYNQTPWGALFWQLTAFARTMRYVPGAQFSQHGGGLFGGYGRFGGFGPFGF